MRRRSVLCAALLVAAVLGVGVAGEGLAQSTNGRRLVLVASRTTTLSGISAEQMRKLYLGMPVAVDGQTLIPLRNNTDPMLEEVFLQHVMFMSGPLYERALLLRLLRTKGTRPQVYETAPELIAALSSQPNAVTYMWAGEALARTDLKIVAELWHE